MECVRVLDDHGSHTTRMAPACALGTRVARVLGLILVTLALLLSASGSALAFDDVPPSHPQYHAIESLVAHGAVDGYTDGTFRPDNSILRAQFAKMILNAFEIEVTEADDSHFSDVERSGPGSLYPDNYVAAAADRGITVGVTPTRFAPYEAITRNQVLTMVVRAIQNLYPTALYAPGTFPWGAEWHGDMPGQSDPTHGENISTAEWNGLLDGLEPWTLNPWDPATRAEISQILVNAKALTTGFSQGRPPLPVGQFPGTQHTGEPVYMLIAGMSGDRGDALQLLWETRAALGEFQTYFILDHSDHYDGVALGQWIVMEPHDGRSSAEDTQSFLPGSTVERLEVTCPDLFGTYDELVGF